MTWKDLRMARIRLNIYHTSAQQVVDAGGSVTTLPFRRLTALFYIGNDAQLRDGFIDTASPLSVFPQVVWERFEKQIE